LDVEILNRLIDGYVFTNEWQWSIKGTSCKLAPAEASLQLVPKE
jgi:hypothetical protein